MVFSKGSKDIDESAVRIKQKAEKKTGHVLNHWPIAGRNNIKRGKTVHRFLMPGGLQTRG